MNFDDFFRIYADVPVYGRAHLFSFIVMILFIIISFIMLRKIHIIYRVMYTTCFIMLGKGVYEFIWQYLALGNISLGDIILSLVCTIPLVYFYYKHNILKINKLFIILLIAQSILFITMILTGWFDAYKLYHAVMGNDPHNWLWGLSRLNGTFLWLSLIKRKVILA